MLNNYTASPDLLRDRVILVTGASDGIGKTAAITFAKHGASVILLGRSQAKLEQTYDVIVNAGYPMPYLMPLDLVHASPQLCDEVAMAIDKQYQRLDGLLHNAASLGRLSPIEHYPTKLWHTVMQTNLNAPFMLTRSLLPLLKQSQTGSLVFTLADVAEHSRAYWGAYASAKAGLRALFETISAEVEASSVRCNAIIPQQIDTKLQRNAFPGQEAVACASPESIMKYYLYLIGKDSAHRNGIVMRTDKVMTDANEHSN